MNEQKELNQNILKRLVAVEKKLTIYEKHFEDMAKLFEEYDKNFESIKRRLFEEHEKNFESIKRTLQANARILDKLIPKPSNNITCPECGGDNCTVTSDENKVNMKCKTCKLDYTETI